MNWILIEALLCDMHWWWRAAGQAYFTWKCNSLLCHSVEIVGCIMLNNLHLLRSNLYPIFLHRMLLFAASFPKRHSLQLSTVILSNSAKAPCVSCLMHTHSQRVSLFTSKLSPLRLWVYVTFFSPICAACHSIMLWPRRPDNSTGSKDVRWDVNQNIW